MDDVIVRKCDECKEEIVVNEDSISNIIYFDSKYYHEDCFIKMCDRKATKGIKKYREKWSNTLKNINTIKKITNRVLMDVLYKDKIYKLIIKEYDISIVPNLIFTKLDAIYTGTYKGMSAGIPPEHLYDMWINKLNFLNKVNVNNKKNGKSIDGSSRVSYDLSILINKYDSYLKWLENNKSNDKEKEEIKENISYNASTSGFISNVNSNKNIKNNVEDDMDMLLDEIFD